MPYSLSGRRSTLHVGLRKALIHLSVIHACQTSSRSALTLTSANIAFSVFSMIKNLTSYTLRLPDRLEPGSPPFRSAPLAEHPVGTKRSGVRGRNPRFRSAPPKRSGAGFGGKRPGNVRPLSFLPTHIKQLYFQIAQHPRSVPANC
jgi:hypothetical protein